MIFPDVDERAVAAVVSDWTGIPVGRMVQDEIEAVLDLADVLRGASSGRTTALAAIARRIETTAPGSTTRTSRSASSCSAAPPASARPRPRWRSPRRSTAASAT